jgi:hypothetical protein
VATAATFVYFAGVMSTLLRSRTFKYGLIFATWAAVVGCVDIIDQTPFDWRPAVWPYASQLAFLKIPGIVVMVLLGAVHGFGSYAIDGSIVIGGSAIFWTALTIVLMAVWSAIRRLIT